MDTRTLTVSTRGGIQTPSAFAMQLAAIMPYLVRKHHTSFLSR